MVAVVKRSTRRLPGFKFEAQAPNLSDVLPRMDIAVFVGFTESGPINTPVSVESAAQFTAIFGQDAPLALDVRTGSNATAFLASAVRAFFRNGGRRCWIVRVAKRSSSATNPLNHAQYNYFRVPGLSRVQFDENGKVLGGIGQAYARARSEGSWSDSLQIASALITRPLEVVGLVHESRTGISINLRRTTASPLSVGDLIRLEYRESVLFMSVGSIKAKDQRTDQVTATKFVWLSGTPDDSLKIMRPDTPRPVALQSASVLSFELWVQKETEYLISIDLAFDESHPHFWGGLPTDEELFTVLPKYFTEPPSILVWKPIGDIFRFPLAGPAERNVFYFPTTMAALPDRYYGRVEQWGTKLERDGLAEFDSELFLDQELKDAGTDVLLSRADYIRDQSPSPRALTGIHTALGIEEATIIAVPDAVHLGWSRATPETLPPPIDEHPPYRPEWWHFADCSEPAIEPKWSLRDCDPATDPPSEIVKRSVHEPLWGNFLDCETEVVDPPALQHTLSPGIGTINFRWSSPAPGATFVLEESSNPDFGDADAVYTGAETKFTLYGRRVGNYYYRVRSQVGRNFSDWSPGIAVGIRNETGWRLKSESEFVPDTLIATHRSLLRLSAARGDLFSVLSLPEHFREDQSIDFARSIKTTSDQSSTAQDVAPFGHGDLPALSYGAIYHPWPIAREETGSSEIKTTPPCGSICGVIANRALERGPWVAPANVALRGVVALSRPIIRERWLDLQEAGINLIRREPRGFLVLDADTLSSDFDLRQISVRRLLSLLKRAALAHGATYVFEPHSESFRRLVKRGFEGLLDRLFERGAFAGTTPANAYRVVVDETLNSPKSIDEGRFIVELRVAPAYPLRFLTVRLVQTNDRGSVSERGN